MLRRLYRMLRPIIGRRRSEALKRIWWSLQGETAPPMALQDFDIIKYNIKNQGYEKARELRRNLPIVEVTRPVTIGLSSKPCTQKDIESKWLWHWCRELNLPVIYHRKMWEFAFVLQALYESGKLKQGLRGVGFGCGEEPLPSLFASRGMDVTVTDLHPDKVAGMGWAETGQHTSSLDSAYYDDLVDRGAFDRHVSLSYVDMNALPAEMNGRYDFCWSICALEHLGSIANGLKFLENSVNVLKAGGVSVHTTEFNYASDREGFDNRPTVLFQRSHFEQICRVLQSGGHEVAPLDFDIGSGAMDNFIDMPPYSYDQGWLCKSNWKNSDQPVHLKMSVEGFPTTCYGMIIRKR